MKEKYFISIITQFSSNTIQFIAYYSLFLKLDAPLLGIWIFLNSVINLGFLFIDIGLDSIHYQYSGKKNSSEYFGSYFFIKQVLLLINITITLLNVTFMQLWSTEFIILILYLLVSKIFYQTTYIFLVNLKTKIKVFKAEIPTFIITLGKSISIIYLAYNITKVFNPVFFLCVSNFIFDLFFILFILLISRNDFVLNKPKKELIYDYLRDVKPLFSFSIILVIATNLGSLILNYSFGNESLGYFSLVYIYIIPLLLSISYSMSSIYLPKFSKFFEEGDILSIKEITHTIEKYTSIIFLLIIIIILLNGSLIFSLFLPIYVNSVPILYIMIFIPYFLGIAHPYSYHFIAGKQQKIIAYINSICRILIILMMILLIPRNFIIFHTLGLGTIGYALSQTIPWIFWSILCHYYSYRYFKLPSQKKILFHLPLAFLSFFIALILKEFVIKLFIQNRIFLLIISSVIALGIFLGFLFIIKEFNREDLKFFLQLFKIKRYIESFKEEFSR